MLLAVLSGFILAIAAPWFFKAFGDRTGWVLAILPAALAVYFGSYIPEVMTGETVVQEVPWIPSLDIELTFFLDGFSLLFAMLITVIGTLVVIYGGGYLKGDKDIPRFYVFILAFMASMLGLVLSDSLISLFVFWELTSITSFMLIGYYHDNAKYRKCAHQSMMVTVGGGLAMMAGLILLMMIVSDPAGAGLQGAEAFSLRAILAVDSGLITGHEFYVPALLLILAGCFTKSAQVPFHFWLPNAMAGPTPVSSYLHSATMVKAGIYLMARLQPGMGGTELWMTLIPIVGATTMFMGMYFALKSTGYKQVLAYSTIMALGVLTMLIGIGTEKAMLAFVAFLLAHAMYKGAFFMIAGIVDHETGTKDLKVLSGLRKKMPITATVAAVVAVSLAGFPPLFGYLGKKMMFETALEAPNVQVYILTLVALTATMGIAVAGLLGVKPFWGEEAETPKPAHEAPLSMLLGPIVLATGSLTFGLAPFFADSALVQAAVTAIWGQETDYYLALWSGFNTAVVMSAVTLVAGLLVYWQWDRVRGVMESLQWLYDHGPEWAYTHGMDRFLPWIAKKQTGIIQNGHLRYYLLTILLTLVTLVGYAFFTRGEITGALSFEVHFYELLVVLVMLTAAFFAASTSSRLGSVAAAGVVGFSVAVVYIFFSAPDLGITQLLVETLTVILLVLVLFRLPEFVSFSTTAARIRDVFVALLVGGMMTALLLATQDVQLYEHDPISHYHIAKSVPEAYGRNIVNVILVDYRTLDTLGEIFVLALAAIGVYAMVKFRKRDERLAAAEASEKEETA